MILHKAGARFRRNPKGWGRFSRFRCRSSLADARYPPHELSSWGPRRMRRSSLLEPEKIGSQRRAPLYADTTYSTPSPPAPSPGRFLLNMKERAMRTIEAQQSSM